MTRAIVLGGGFAGLLAARVLSERFDEVLLLERDQLPEAPTGRQGAVQGRFPHVLLGGGQRRLDRWFPGLQARLEDHGAGVLDWPGDTAVFHLGGWMPRFASDLQVRACSRPLLEWAVRQELQARTQVQVRAQVDVGEVDLHGPSVVADGERLDANLLVDATGRGSRAVRWLNDQGFGQPRIDEVTSQTAYATRTIRLPAESELSWRCLYVMPQPGTNRRSGLIYPIEQGLQVVNLVGYDGVEPPADAAEFEAFAESLAVPDLADALRAAEPLSPILRYRAAYHRFIRFDRMARWPRGFVVLGDALCGVNPVYGQGISITARQAELLGAQGDRLDARRFQRAVGRRVTVPWLLGVVEDLRWPSSTGPLGPLRRRLLTRLVEQVHRAGQRDLAVYRVLAEVMHMTLPVPALLRPAIAWRILRFGGRRAEAGPRGSQGSRSVDERPAA